jgi:hypothetical protein
LPSRWPIVLVEPALRLPEAVRLVCREGRLTALLADLAVHRLDMVIADRPMPSNLNVRGYSHLLGESDLTVFAAGALIKTLNGKFPALLHGAPFLMPGDDVAIRPRLEQWLATRRLHPRIVGEFDDSALLQGVRAVPAPDLFVAPTAIAERRRANNIASVRVGRLEIGQRAAVRHHQRAAPESPGHRRHQPDRARRGISALRARPMPATAPAMAARRATAAAHPAAAAVPSWRRTPPDLAMTLRYFWKCH